MTIAILSHLLLWVVAITQSLLVLALMRQVGTILMRTGSAAKPLRSGPEIGEKIRPIRIPDVADRELGFDVTTSMAKGVLLFFMSSNCAVCNDLIPALRSLVLETRDSLGWAIVLLAKAGSSQCDKFRKRHKLGAVTVCCAEDVREHFKVGISPYAIVIDSDGVVIAKGLCNNVEHVESLLDVFHTRTAPKLVDMETLT